MCWNAGIHIARIVRETSITSLKWSLTKWLRPAETNNIYFFCFKLNGWNEFLEKIMKNNEFPSLSIDLVHTKPFVFWKYSRIPCWIIISRKAQLIHEKTNNHLKKYSKREKKNTQSVVMVEMEVCFIIVIK